MSAKTLSKAEAIKKLWRLGNLKFKLDVNQLEMYDHVMNSTKKVSVIGCSRRLGKSWFLVVLGVETCIKKPNQIVKMIAPKIKDVRKIIRPLMKEILIDCPEDLKPKFNTQDNIYKFPNGSEIQLAGTDNDTADSIRGGSANLCLVDEAGFCDDLSYVVNSILMPTTTTTNGKIVMASTPSKSASHDFMSFIEKAKFEGRFLKKTIYDNPRLSPEQIQEIAEALPGGVNGTDFKREYMVETITSEDDAVVPEFTAELKEIIVRDWQRPSHFDWYSAMDIGTKDLTVVLFAYYDFQHSKIIIEDEVVLSGKKMLTDTLASLIKAKEAELFNDLSGTLIPPHLRVSDNNNLILLNDLTVKHNITFLPTAKDNAEAALNAMRMRIKNQQVIINPKCKTLIYHLESAIWNKQRTSYARSVDAGHYDAVDALKYLVRNVNFNKNPFPVGAIDSNTFTNQNYNQNKTDFEQKLEQMATSIRKVISRRR